MEVSLMPIYIAIFIPLLILIVQRNALLGYNVVKRKRMRGKNKMDNILQKCVGKRCVVSTGSLGIKVDGYVKQVTDKWIEIESRNKTEILGLDFIQYIKIKNK